MSDSRSLNQHQLTKQKSKKYTEVQSTLLELRDRARGKDRVELMPVEGELHPAGILESWDLWNFG